LLGGGNQYRYILLKQKGISKAYVKKIMKKEYDYSLSLIKDTLQIMQSNIIVKSVSAVKRKKKGK
jgi:hypothetical protein